eukprot:UN06131
MVLFQVIHLNIYVVVRIILNTSDVTDVVNDNRYTFTFTKWTKIKVNTIWISNNNHINDIDYLDLIDYHDDNVLWLNHNVYKMDLDHYYHYLLLYNNFYIYIHIHYFHYSYHHHHHFLDL